MIEGALIDQAGAAYADIGPAVPSRLTVYAAAAEVLACARLAGDLALPGPAMDVPRALRQLERCRAVLGPNPAAAAPSGRD